jgi:hypothetical protein
MTSSSSTNEATIMDWQGGIGTMQDGIAHAWENGYEADVEFMVGKELWDDKSQKFKQHEPFFSCSRLINWHFHFDHPFLPGSFASTTLFRTMAGQLRSTILRPRLSKQCSHFYTRMNFHRSIVTIFLRSILQVFLNSMQILPLFVIVSKEILASSICREMQ